MITIKVQISDAVLFLCADIAIKLGRRDASDLSPTDIAIEALEQIGNFLKADNGGYAR
ncbi:shikimate kinase [Trifolium pratense]|uniref:Shikimate kinase n=1 Tax=Trifolium pratense TaxID=57577 RepID=A0A2K3JYN6_TRIPR|nr:shikimate kinase [Trifolium pratense]